MTEIDPRARGTPDQPDFPGSGAGGDLAAQGLLAEPKRGEGELLDQRTLTKQTWYRPRWKLQEYWREYQDADGTQMWEHYRAEWRRTMPPFRGTPEQIIAAMKRHGFINTHEQEAIVRTDLTHPNDHDPEQETFDELVPSAGALHEFGPVDGSYFIVSSSYPGASGASLYTSKYAKEMLQEARSAQPDSTKTQSPEHVVRRLRNS